MPENLAIFEIIALFVAPPITAVVGNLIRKYFKDDLHNYLEHRFHQYWDGREENEYYAWQRVRQYVMQTSADERKLKFIDRKMDSLNRVKIKSQQMLINQDGQLINKSDT
jgi:hypothetical protein